MIEAYKNGRNVGTITNSKLVYNYNNEWKISCGY